MRGRRAFRRRARECPGGACVLQRQGTRMQRAPRDGRAVNLNPVADRLGPHVQKGRQEWKIGVRCPGVKGQGQGHLPGARLCVAGVSAGHRARRELSRPVVGNVDRRAQRSPDGGGGGPAPSCVRVRKALGGRLRPTAPGAGERREKRVVPGAGDGRPALSAGSAWAPESQALRRRRRPRRPPSGPSTGGRDASAAAGARGGNVSPRFTCSGPSGSGNVGVTLPELPASPRRRAGPALRPDAAAGTAAATRGGSDRRRASGTQPSALERPSPPPAPGGAGVTVRPVLQTIALGPGASCGADPFPQVPLPSAVLPGQRH